MWGEFGHYVGHGDMDNPPRARICRAQAARPLLKYVPNECMIFPPFVNALTFRSVGNELPRRGAGLGLDCARARCRMPVAARVRHWLEKEVG